MTTISESLFIQSVEGFDHTKALTLPTGIFYEGTREDYDNPKINTLNVRLIAIKGKRYFFYQDTPKTIKDEHN